MKRNEDEVTKKMMQKGVRQIPSENFNNRVIHRLEQERQKEPLKPAGNQSLLVVLASALLILSGVILYLQGATEEVLSSIKDPAGIMQLTLAVLSIVFVYAVYTLLADFIESRGGWKSSHYIR